MRAALNLTADSQETAVRTRQQLPIDGNLARLEGRADDAMAQWRHALQFEEPIDILGQAAETRMRLARALANDGQMRKAAEVLQPVFERAEIEARARRRPVCQY